MTRRTRATIKMALTLTRRIHLGMHTYGAANSKSRSNAEVVSEPQSKKRELPSPINVSFLTKVASLKAYRREHSSVAPVTKSAEEKVRASGC